MAAIAEEGIIGGPSAWELLLTARQSHAPMVNDLAIEPAHWRKGVGRRLVASLLRQTRERAIPVARIPVDNQGTHALDFNRSGACA